MPFNFTISGRVIDCGGITVPTIRIFDIDGKWFKEGRDIDPDIEDHVLLLKAVDLQLEKAIEEVMRLHKESPPVNPKQPPYEKR